MSELLGIEYSTDLLLLSRNLESSLASVTLFSADIIFQLLI